MFNWIKRNSVISYFVIAYAVSWSFEIPLALFHHGIISAQIPMWFHYFACLGPLSAALIMTFLTDGRLGVRNLMARIFKWRVDVRYYVFAILIPAGLFAFACVLNRMITGNWPNLTLLAR